MAMRERAVVRALRPTPRNGPPSERRSRDPARAGRSRIWIDGLLAGVAAAVTLAVWFLVVDAVAGRPLRTPTVLGTALFRGGSGLDAPDAVPISLPMILGFTWVHVAVFLLIGLGAAALLALAERNAHLGFGVVLLFVFFEGGYLFGVWMFAQPLLHALAWPTVVVGNLLAAVAMGAVFRWRRPRLTICP
jgi:hypothetical protein